ncbi:MULTISPECIES: dynamin family protein [unclassified Ruegeria]|uniref:dynamin family protein n=1 Tax=unclassified Ruegeria TaxID=2625375 RepID=UPI0014894027|nr:MULTISPECIES: dynamin family protein [unclassified Ruegeria]
MVNTAQTRFVTPKAWDRIEKWSRRKPVFALMGEFSAGKSTLMNFLLRKQTLPTQVTATQLPPVWFSFGEGSAYVLRHDGSKEMITLDQLDQVGVNDVQFVRIFLEADILEAVDLIDTPGISDPKISNDVWRRAVGQANGVLWCTHSTQAWRETERATWVSLPERLQANSLLLVTRADALNTKDRQKVLRRVNREAGHLFNRSILFSARDAIIARDKTGDAEMWGRSGGGKMVDSFLEITEQIMGSRAEMLSRYQMEKSTLPGIEKIKPLRPAKPSEAKDDVTTVRVIPPENADTETVTSFPVRPARVERRSDEIERPRIEAEEAEKLRQEMIVDEDEVTAKDQNVSFSDDKDEAMDLDFLPNPATDVDEFEFQGEEEPEPEDELTVSDTSEDDPVEEEIEIVEIARGVESDIERSVSSITALLAEKSEEDYEPEPESNALTDGQVVPMQLEDDVADAPEPDMKSLIQVVPGTPISAVDLWNEFVSKEELPDDANGLRSVFSAFLTEFDQISRDYQPNSDQPVSPIGRSEENSAAERHAL